MRCGNCPRGLLPHLHAIECFGHLLRRVGPQEAQRGGVAGQGLLPGLLGHGELRGEAGVQAAVRAPGQVSVPVTGTCPGGVGLPEPTEGSKDLLV